MITSLAVSGYRSLRDIVIGLDQLNVVTGANGSGKSSLYRGIRLLAEIAQGRIIRAISSEGGFTAALWAGEGEGATLKLGFATDDYGYAIDLGIKFPSRSMFDYDPVIKAESLWVGQVLGERNEIASRKGPSVRVRDEKGHWAQALTSLSPFDSMMTHAADPGQALELLRMREMMRNWRFYDQFRSDNEAPVRRPQVATFTPILASDGSDLAAALQTIIEIGFHEDLVSAVDDAFPGTKIELAGNGGHCELAVHQSGLKRPLGSAELSDGTLRYLCLVAALLSPRPPPFMVLNEPEMSLHPSLLPALGRLIAKASEQTQILIVSHSSELVAAIDEVKTTRRIVLEKVLGETQIADNEEPRWEWLTR